MQIQMIGGIPQTVFEEAQKIFPTIECKKILKANDFQ